MTSPWGEGASAPDAEPGTCVIERLFIYPIKSCRGIEVESTKVLDEGLEHDRRWMIVDQHGRFLSQRERPEMARIVPEFKLLGQDELVLRFSIANPAGRVDTASPYVDLIAFAPGPFRKVEVWDYASLAIDCGEQAALILSDFLQCPVRLVRFSASETRVCNPKWTGSLQGRTLFTDGYPILVLGSNSVDDLAKRLGLASLPVERFRPNVLLSGLPAYDEDFIKDLLPVAHPVSMRLVKPCTRCTIPAVDPWTGQPGSVDPTAELATYRYHSGVEGAVLGMNALVFQGQGQILKRGQTFQALYDF
jgi:uncharacterized protein